MTFRPLFVLAAIAAVGAHAQESATSVQTEWSVPPYTIILETSLDDAAPGDDLTVLADGTPVYHLADAVIRSDLTLGPETIADDMGKPMPGHDPEIAPGNDVLGLGFPNLVFADYSGGTQCCFRAVILMLDRPFRTQTADSDHSGQGFRFDTGHPFRSVSGHLIRGDFGQVG
jgi:hypothetical protein